MKNNLWVLLIVFLVSCSNDQKKIHQYSKIFATEIKSEDIVVRENQTASSLYEKLMRNCDEDETGYTGDYIIQYDLVKKEFSFANAPHPSLINIKFEGFLCPNTSKDIFFNELEVIWKEFIPNTSLQRRIQEHINKSIETQAYPYLINVVVPDTIYINQLQGVFNEILDAYASFYEEIKYYKNLLEANPLRVRITPELYYNKVEPAPPPTDE